MEDGKLLRKILSPHWWDLSPLEAKIFITLYWWADPDTGELSISLYRLSRKINESTSSILAYLQKLRFRGLLFYSLSKYHLLDSQFKIVGNKYLSSRKNTIQNPEEVKYVPFASEDKRTDFEPQNDNDGRSNDFIKNNKIVNDKNNINKNVNIGKINGTETLGKKEKLSTRANFNFTAESIAKRFRDEGNLALYKAYLKRYPKSIILKAYQEVVKTPPQRIKKSPGAFFTFLVKKYGEKGK